MPPKKRPAGGRSPSGRPAGAGRPRGPQPPRAAGQRPAAPKPESAAPALDGEAPAEAATELPVDAPVEVPADGVPGVAAPAKPAPPRPAAPKPQPAARRANVAPAKGPTAESAAKREEARAAAKERRLEAQRRQKAAERKRQVRNWSIIGVAVIVVALLIGVGVVHSKDSKKAFATLSAAAGCGTVQDTTTLAGTTVRTHMTTQEITSGVTVTYSTSPPSGGKHYPVPLPKGVYGALPTDPRQNPNLYQAVHSLEHGYVDIWYGPNLSSDQIASLSSFAKQDKVLVISYPNLVSGKAVAMTTWGRYMACNQLNTKQIQAYIDRYKLLTGPEPNAA